MSLLAVLFAASLGMPSQASRVVEIPSPTASGVQVEAIVRMPELGPRQRATLRYLAEMLRAGSRTFTGDQIRRISLENGGQFGVTTGIDHLRFTLRGVDLTDALTMTFSLLTEPAFPVDAYNAARERLPFRQGDRWSRSANPERLPWDSVRYDHIQQLQIETFLAGSTTLAVTGRFNLGEATQKWSEMTVAWPRPPRSRLQPDLTAGGLWATVPGKVGMIELRGPEFSHRPLDNQLLALVMLGDLKTGSLFRVVREKLGVSYMSQAVLSPTQSGWRTRLFIPSAGGDLGAKAREAKAALLEDVDSWSEEQRALGVSAATRAFTFEGDERPPIVLHGAFPVSSEEELYLFGYWLSKTGQAWPDSRDWKARFENVALEDLKDAAKAILNAGSPILMPGAG